MKERPILFTTPMVKAILEGRKTQTRRIVKPMAGFQKTWLTQGSINRVQHGEIIKGGWQMYYPYYDNSPLGWIRSPYGNSDDILWVRETWSKTDSGRYIYKATNNQFYPIWHPSIFMPKEACRIRLEITNIRVERVQDISEEDAVAEGIKKIDGPVIGHPFGIPFNYNNGIVNYTTPRDAYMELWESINGKDSWGKNPWVWVIEFKRIKP